MKILVTSALPYANYSLHLGHIRSTYIPADIYTRYHRLAGNEVYYVGATDEHGTPITVMAEKNGMSPGAWAKKHYIENKALFEKYFSLDIFDRSSSPENENMAIDFFNKLKKNGYVYDKEVTQLYCEVEKRFLPDRLVKGTCPYCGSKDQYGDGCEDCGRTYTTLELRDARCAGEGSKPIQKKSNHFFLKLPALKDKLEEWLTSNKELQPEVVNYVKTWLKDLRDWDFTRDMSWGVPVPGKKGQVFYVWFDAPIEYVTASSKVLPTRWKTAWNKWKVVHFIGKDISYHHFLYWPAILMGAGFRAPSAIPVRGWLLFRGKKLSKSRGNIILIKDFLKDFSFDTLRYYETAITPYAPTDADFTWKDFQAKINNDLIANFGNYVNRTLTLAKKHGKVTQPKDEDFDARDKKIFRLIGKVRREVAKDCEVYHFKSAQEKIMALSSEFNKYLSDKEPWKEKDRDVNNKTFYVCLRGLTALSILFRPFIPDTSKKLAVFLSIKESDIKWKNIDKLTPPVFSIEYFEPLFQKIDDKKIEQLENS